MVGLLVRMVRRGVRRRGRRRAKREAIAAVCKAVFKPTTGDERMKIGDGDGNRGREVGWTSTHFTRRCSGKILSIRALADGHIPDRLLDVKANVCIISY